MEVRENNGFLRPRKAQLEVGDEVEHPNLGWSGKVLSIDKDGIKCIVDSDDGIKFTKQQGLRHCPTPETIAKRAAALRATWSKSRWMHACGQESPDEFAVTITEISTHCERRRTTVGGNL